MLAEPRRDRHHEIRYPRPNGRPDNRPDRRGDDRCDDRCGSRHDDRCDSRNDGRRDGRCDGRRDDWSKSFHDIIWYTRQIPRMVQAVIAVALVAMAPHFFVVYEADPAVLMAAAGTYRECQRCFSKGIDEKAIQVMWSQPSTFSPRTWQFGHSFERAVRYCAAAASSAPFASARRAAISAQEISGCHTISQVMQVRP